MDPEFSVDIRISASDDNYAESGDFFVSQSDFEHHFAKHKCTAADDFFLAIDTRNTGQSHPCRIIRVRRRNMQDSPSSPSPTLPSLFGSSWLIQRHFLHESTYSCCTVEPITLSRIIVAVRSKEAREEIHRLVAGPEFLNDVITKTVLLAQGDTLFPDNSQAVVLKCDPVLQGLLGLETEIIISEFLPASGRQSRRTSSVASHRGSFSFGSRPSLGLAANSHDLKLFENVVKFASIFSRPARLPMQKLALVASQAITKLVSDNLRTQNLLKVCVLTKPVATVSIDPLNTAFVSSSVYRKICREDHMHLCWLELIFDSIEDKRDKKRLVILEIFPEKLAESFDPGEDEIYLSPTLYFSAGSSHPNLTQQSCAIELSAISAEEKLIFHSTVRLSLVRFSGAKDDDIDKYQSRIGKYFHQPRIVQTGDVIVLHCLHSAIECVYLKVTGVEPETSVCGLAQTGRTFLFLGGLVGSFLPAMMECYLNNKPFHPLLDSPLPVVFDQYVTHVMDVWMAYGNSSAELDCCRYPAILIAGKAGHGKQVICRSLARRLNVRLFEINVAGDLIADTAASMEARIKTRFDQAVQLAPCLIVLRHLDHFTKGKSEPRVWQSLHKYFGMLSQLSIEKSIFVVGTCSTAISSQLEDLFPVVIQIKSLTEPERATILQTLMSMHTDSDDLPINYQSLAARTAGFSVGDLFGLVERAEKHSLERVKSLDCARSVFWERTIEISGMTLQQEDFNAALAGLQHSQNMGLGKPNIPNVEWEDIGGLDDIKKDILQTVELSLQNAQIRASGLQRTGILLYGPPGNGKTLLAKAIASQCGLNFISVKGPELINMYVGQSEENVREVFERARQAAPCIVFFDEIDSLAPNRGKSGDSGGVVDRVVSQLMTEMDGLTKRVGVFVFGATNRPDLLDPALLRPGRFDKSTHVGNPVGGEARLKVLRAITRKCQLENAADTLEALERLLPEEMSGADLSAVCADAMQCALKRLISEGRTDEVPVLRLEDFAASCTSETA